MSQAQSKNTRATVARTLHFYWQVTKTAPGPFALAIVSTIGFITLLTYGNPLVMGLVVDRIQAAPVAPEDVWRVFGPYIAALVAVNVVGQTCSKLQDYAIYKMEINANYRLARLCFDTLSNQSMTFHSNRLGGSLVSQTSKFMHSYSLLLETSLLSVVPTVIGVVCTVGILAPVVPAYVAALCVVLAAYVAVAYTMFSKIMPLAANAAKAQNRLSGVLSDAVTNILAVKTCGQENYERELFDEADRAAMRADSISMHATIKRGIMTSSIIVVIMTLVSVFLVGGNAWLGISTGTLVMMFTYTYSLTSRFNMINSMLTRLNKAFGDAADMTRVLDEPTLVADAPGARDLAVSAGRIEFRDLSFAYQDAEGASSNAAQEASDGTRSQSKTDQGNEASESVVPHGTRNGVRCEEEQVRSADAQGVGSIPSHLGAAVGQTRVFDRLNLSIPAGQRVGLVGQSGSGKTTLTKLLLRLSDIQQGSVLVDGQDVSACAQQSLRRQIAYVPQEALLFHRSIRENIAYAKPQATEEEIREAARLANALDFIDKLPRGMDTMVGERGVKLSGGQRQRVAIARAILADAPILVLDEATSALDSESEALVQEALGNLMRGRTSIVVAHRLSTVASLDRIVVLSQGRIVEDGTHEELIAAGGEYARLWNRQTGAFLE